MNDWCAHVIVETLYVVLWDNKFPKCGEHYLSYSTSRNGNAIFLPPIVPSSSIADKHAVFHFVVHILVVFHLEPNYSTFFGRLILFYFMCVHIFRPPKCEWRDTLHTATVAMMVVCYDGVGTSFLFERGRK